MIITYKNMIDNRTVRHKLITQDVIISVKTC